MRRFAIITAWINAVFTRTGTLVFTARNMNWGTARNVWTFAKPAPTPAFTANSARAASSGNSAAKKPRSAAKRMRGKRGKGKKAKRVKNQSGETGVSPVWRDIGQPVAAINRRARHALRLLYAIIILNNFLAGNQSINSSDQHFAPVNAPERMEVSVVLRSTCIP
jgi:hypothetical protein